MANNIKMVVTDLDGTLAKSDSSVCDVDIETLEKLGELGLCRVIATGRSLYSARTVLNDDFPIDYLVFSTGAGIMDWNTKTIIKEEHLPKDEVESISRVLNDHKVDFTIQHKIPNNHCFSYLLHNKENVDFMHRLEIYKGFEQPLDLNSIEDATQILAILEDDIDWFEELRSLFDDIKVVRTTSPLNGKSIWMEIFPKHVSKAYGINYLCEMLKINKSQTIGIGNDYNDIDLLDFCKYSFVVSNAPKDLKRKYPSVASNDMNGFTDFINKLIKKS